MLSHPLVVNGDIIHCIKVSTYMFQCKLGRIYSNIKPLKEDLKITKEDDLSTEGSQVCHYSLVRNLLTSNPVVFGVNTCSNSAIPLRKEKKL